MNDQLNYMITQLRIAELQRAGERARFARAARPGRRKRPERAGWARPNPSMPSSAHPGLRHPRGITALELEPTFGSER